MANSAGFPGVEINSGRIRIRISKTISNRQVRLHFHFQGNQGLPTPRNLEAASRLRKKILQDIADKSTKFNQDSIKKKYFSGKEAPLPADSLAAVCVKWLDYANTRCENEDRGYKKSTITSAKEILNSQWLPTFGDYNILDITYDDIHNYLRLPHHDQQEKTMKNWVSALSRIFKFAKTELRLPISQNPCNDMTCGARPNKSKHRPQQLKEPFRKAEIAAIFEKLKKESLEAQTYFTIFRGTGMRTCEILALEFNDIDGDEAWVTKGIVRGDRINSTKTWESRTVYLQPQVRQMIEKLEDAQRSQKVVPINRTDYIFKNPDGYQRATARCFNKAWRRAVESARLDRADAKAIYREMKRKNIDESLIKDYLSGRIPYRDPYKLRHTRASELIDSGAAEEGPFELGHSPEMFYRIYARKMKDKENEGKDRSKLNTKQTISNAD